MRIFSWIIAGIFLAQIGFADEVAPQAARILKQITGVQKLLKVGDKKLKDHLTVEVLQQIRAHAFNLEELFRAYEKQHPKKLEGAKDLMKSLEDRVGQLVDASEHVRMAEKMGVSKQAAAYLKGQRDTLAGQLEHFLTDKNELWLGNNETVLKDLSASVMDVNWGSENEDRKFLIEHFQELYGKIGSGEYDLKQTQGENGLHQLRRDLRKTVILQLALNYDGKLVTTPESIPEYDYLTKDVEFTKSKYGYLPNSKPRKLPVLFPYPLYLAGAKQVQNMGLAKDILEAKEEWLPHALTGSGEIKRTQGEQKSEFEARLKRDVKKHMDKVPEWKSVNMGALKRKTQASLLDGSFLSKLNDTLEEQHSWSKKDCRKALAQLVDQ